MRLIYKIYQEPYVKSDIKYLLRLIEGLLNIGITWSYQVSWCTIVAVSSCRLHDYNLLTIFDSVILCIIQQIGYAFMNVIQVYLTYTLLAMFSFFLLLPDRPFTNRTICITWAMPLRPWLSIMCTLAATQAVTPGHYSIWRHIT